MIVPEGKCSMDMGLSWKGVLKSATDGFRVYLASVNRQRSVSCSRSTNAALASIVGVTLCLSKCACAKINNKAVMFKTV